VPRGGDVFAIGLCAARTIGALRQGLGQGVGGGRAFGA
jgi:hypothetical protein